MGEDKTKEERKTNETSTKDDHGFNHGQISSFINIMVKVITQIDCNSP